MEQNNLSTREQKRLMSEDSNSGEISGEFIDDSIALCRDYEKKTGCCGRLMHSKAAKLATMLFLILGYFFAELIVGKDIRF